MLANMSILRRREFIPQFAFGVGGLALLVQSMITAFATGRTISIPTWMQPDGGQPRMIPPFVPPTIDRRALNEYPLTPNERKLLALIPPEVQRPLIVLGPAADPDANGRLKGPHIFVPGPVRTLESFVYLALKDSYNLDKWERTWADTLQLAGAMTDGEVRVVGRLNGQRAETKALQTSAEMVTRHLIEKFGQPDATSGLQVPHAKYDAETEAASLDFRFVQPQDIKRIIQAGNALTVLYGAELLKQGVDVTQATISLVGSVAEGRAVRSSDIDIAVEFKHPKAFYQAIGQFVTVPRMNFKNILADVYADILGIKNTRDIPDGQQIIFVLKDGNRVIDIFSQMMKP